MNRILVAEDDKTMNSGLCYNLQLDQYQTVAAYTSKEALTQVKLNPFNLAVLDVNLPDGDGFGLCKEIKAFQDIPVIFLCRTTIHIGQLEKK